MNNDALIAELDKLHEKATPGEWGEGEGCCGSFLDYQAHPSERDGYMPTSDYDGREPLWLGGSVREEDRKFIAALRNAWPRIRDELTRLQAEVARVEERVWPDDLESGVRHALEIASLQSGLPQALAAIQAEIDEHCVIPERPYECYHCGAVREFAATRLVEAQDDALRLHREKMEQWERIAQLTAALRELVRLKDLHDAIEDKRLHRPREWTLADCVLDDGYQRDKVIAWAAARAIQEKP